jgi:hypothetical protein
MKSNGYYPKKCKLCSEPNAKIIIYPMTEDEEKQIIDFIKVNKKIVYLSLFYWCKIRLLYRPSLREFKKDIEAILHKNNIRKKDFIFKGVCPILGNELIKSKAFMIWDSEHK